MKCPSCNSEMQCKSEDYEYVESGLDGVFLKETEIFRCKCGEDVISVPAVSSLNELIGKELIKKDSLMSGKEIRFLRKNIGVSATRLAEIMGVDVATVSRWENDNQPLSKAHDRMLRLIYAELKNISHKDRVALIEQFFSKISPKRKTIANLNIYPWMWSKSKNSRRVGC